jgi:glycosyltransferase involved in cell wall biosynthesis
LSAGRSGRDYPLLTRVFASSGRRLRIVCDSAQSLAGCSEAPNIEVLRQCYDANYVSELRGAGMVVVPLAVDDISAGQMVVLQAMAYRKPIIVTDIPTLKSYLGDPPAALLIHSGSAADLDSAVEQLIGDSRLARALSDRAYAHYASHHSMAAFVANIVSVVRGTRVSGSPQKGAS